MSKVKGVNKKKAELFVQAGILTVADLVAATEPPQGFAAKSFTTIKSNVLSYIPPTAPPSIDHRKHDNPYLSLCSNEWLTKI